MDQKINYFQSEAKKIYLINKYMAEMKTESNKQALTDGYKDVLQTITPFDIFQLDDYSNETILTIDEIKKDASKFVNIFNQGLKHFVWNKKCSALMIHFLKENQAIKNLLNEIKSILKTDLTADSLKQLKTDLTKLLPIEDKFIVQQNVLFPILERKVPTTKPLKVMWSLHDEAKRKLKNIIESLEQQDFDLKAFQKNIGEFYFILFGIMNKEETILFPIASHIVGDEEWELMYEDAGDYPSKFITPIPQVKDKERKSNFIKGKFTTKNGDLSFEQLDLILNILPFDFTYIDENDCVRYYNDAKERIFPRSPSVIGRNVELCHPPKSLDLVKQIIDAFRQNERNSAEFWFEHKDRFIHITYLAVRDLKGEYRGILEISQDAGHLRSLVGTKRLLDWE